ncbi:succinate dehydrogenase/fumarate reductase iron-sulfur subunit [Sphingobacteriales bacterium UPWRP_1]|nr:succinate dehydrogenase/fumarate reductase iron-sulfur subunit [Sphingobacteriales bacterium TSM_CSS]PSJ74643.1 succinate dehydrogenase/fumarate reductase iron-sulfur subunit [Sphingobacteriales bacterium UPWRP_1]
MKITLKVWRQKNAQDSGRLETYTVSEVEPDMSFLEMMDVLNQQLIKDKKDPVAFDHDCREGICGMCSMVINGHPHGHIKATTTCQLHMRSFKDGDTIVVEPWRAKAFPVIKDLAVDRSAFDKIIQAGGFVSVNTGSAPEANSVPVPQDMAEKAMDAAECIGCGACVAACKNSSAMLFLSAKVSHMALLPQGQPERKKRVISMMKAHDEAGFGSCTNTEACEAYCPKGISITNIARLNREFLSAALSSEQPV